jgi:hypothetical protein
MGSDESRGGRTVSSGDRIDVAGPSREAKGDELDSPQPPIPEIAPVPRRNYMMAIVVGLIVFALLIGIRVFWGGIGDRQVPSLPLTEQTAPQEPAPSN